MSKHPDADQMAAQAPQSQPTPILGLSNVAKIFQSLTSKELSGMAQPNAHREALATKGMKTSKPATSKTSNATTDERKTSAHRQPSSQMFHVSSVAIVTCGLDISSTFAFSHWLLTLIKANGQLKDEPLPQASAEKRPIQINTAWMHEQRELSTPLDNPQPDWQLLVPGGNGKLELSGAVCPNGIVLACFKGRQKSSVVDSNLWFVTRNPVLKQIFKGWKTVPDIVGTDVETISDEDHDEGSDDKEIVNLSSSIIDLKIGIVAETGNVIRLSLDSNYRSSRQAFCKKRKDMNSNALPAWPRQSGKPITAPLSTKEVADKDNINASPRPNPTWLSTFEQLTISKDDEISDFDE
ncbi:hypothetical protein SCLCIDRAFT_34042 [Scleroderma citrinum Foug A]|uniref:Uncharacterized protein n=1 Tax=Scleroderma citrinum Foug A TaxID=1036808 RepID=A0A0C2ZCI9_9AGAM|nr:hypothetical protein SCLCIDRAFT_34042 [Scleroderma citrinum Foug A]